MSRARSLGTETNTALETWRDSNESEDGDQDKKTLEVRRSLTTNRVHKERPQKESWRIWGRNNVCEDMQKLKLESLFHQYW